jgi:DNA (cytosine-5)-methyltransferase 1
LTAKKREASREPRRVVELFAGVGGFRLGLEKAGWEVVWSNQWEPATKTQHAFDCYAGHFKTGIHVNEDIGLVMDAAEKDPSLIPDHELVCGGFPCQDYSVAKTLSQARGLQGKKGVLWWEIHRLLKLKRPPFVLLENVDRLLKSPATQRGRDFAIILACLAELGYVVEWRMVNAADYGFPQRRRRVFILARPPRFGDDDPTDVVHESGVLARALPVRRSVDRQLPLAEAIPTDLLEVSETFGGRNASSPFETAGVMKDFKFWSFRTATAYRGKRRVLRGVLEDDVPEEYLIPKEQVAAWRYLKGAKREPRTNESGFSYTYNEGAVRFPEPLDEPSRTILTGEGGTSPSRFKHIIQTDDGRFRRLTPVELERLNGFPPGWTDTGMSDARRAFMMGNALVVGLVQRIGQQLIHEPRPSTFASSDSLTSIHSR